jgi:hypothetical protein
VLLVSGALTSLYSARTLRRGMPAWSADQQADRIFVVRTSHDEPDAAVRVGDKIVAADVSRRRPPRNDVLTCASAEQYASARSP